MRERRILYGVVGSGLGHAMRAQVIAEHLRATGHRVMIASSGRALSLLRSRGFESLAIRGADFVFSGGRVAWGSTLFRLLSTAPDALSENLRTCRSVIRRWRPDAVVTDFESVTSLAGTLMGVPVISLDHQHVIDRCHHPKRVVDRVSRYRLLRAVCAAKTFSCTRYIVSSFFFPRLEAENTTLVGPILRPEVEAALSHPARPRHVLVYQTSSTDQQLVPTLLEARTHRFVVYGLQREERIGNVQLRRFDQQRFIEDLSGASAVITNGGYSTIGEAAALNKPVLAIPVRGQPEQELNAAWVDVVGAGLCASALTPGVLRHFLSLGFCPPHEPRLLTGRRDACLAVDQALEAA